MCTPSFFFPIRVECLIQNFPKTVVADLHMVKFKLRILHAKNKQLIPIQFDDWNMAIVTVLENEG